MTRCPILLGVVTFFVSCSEVDRTITGAEYLKAPAFTGTVLNLELLPWDKNQTHHSGASAGFKLDVRLENGERLRIMQAWTDVTWTWAQRLMTVVPGKTYRFAPVEQKHPELLEADR